LQCKGQKGSDHCTLAKFRKQRTIDAGNAAALTIGEVPGVAPRCGLDQTKEPRIAARL